MTTYHTIHSYYHPEDNSPSRASDIPPGFVASLWWHICVLLVSLIFMSMLFSYPDYPCVVSGSFDCLLYLCCIRIVRLPLCMCYIRIVWLPFVSVLYPNRPIILCMCCIRIAFVHVMSLTHPDSAIILMSLLYPDRPVTFMSLLYPNIPVTFVSCVVFRSTDYFVCLSYIRKVRLPLCQMYPGWPITLCAFFVSG